MQNDTNSDSIVINSDQASVGIIINSDQKLHSTPATPTTLSGSAQTLIRASIVRFCKGEQNALYALKTATQWPQDPPSTFAPSPGVRLSSSSHTICSLIFLDRGFDLPSPSCRLDRTYSSRCRPAGPQYVFGRMIRGKDCS